MPPGGTRPPPRGPRKVARPHFLESAFTLEHGKVAYRADFVLYAAAVPALAVLLNSVAPQGRWAAQLLLVLAGLIAWSAIEYVLHRFVLHRVRPFRAWHEAHHDRPTALICAPTLLSSMLIVALVFGPLWLLGGLWRACALTLGVVSGYLAYAITHHATHHWRANSRWLRKRKRWHALHHHSIGGPSCYGVTSGFWDHVFGSAAPVAAHRA